MNLLLRLAVKTDAPAIARFNLALAQESEGLRLDRGIVTAGVETLLARPEHGFYIVAQDGSTIVGITMISYEWSDWRNKMIWWLQSVYVDPACRRQGVFSRIYHYIHDLAKRDGTVDCLRLYAEKENRAAHRTYTKLGMAKRPYRIFEQPLSEQEIG